MAARSFANHLDHNPATPPRAPSHLSPLRDRTGPFLNAYQPVTSSTPKPSSSRTHGPSGTRNATAGPSRIEPIPNIPMPTRFNLNLATSSGIPAIASHPNDDDSPLDWSLCTPSPPQGFPTIHGLTRDWLTQGMLARTTNEWSKINVFDLIIVWGICRAYWSDIPLRTTILSLIRKHIAIITGRNENDFNVLPPIPDPNVDLPPSAGPYAAIITGLTRVEARELFAHGGISSEDITFWVHPSEIPPTSYVGNVRNLLGGLPQNHEQAREFLINALRTDHAVSDFLTRTANERNLVPATEINRTLRSITLSPYTIAGPGGTLHNIWRLYVSPPTQNHENYREWMSILQNVRITIPFYEDASIATAGNDWSRCSACKSADHPTGLCDHPAIPGWYATLESWTNPNTLTTAPTTQQPTTHTTHANAPTTVHPVSLNNPGTIARSQGRANGHGTRGGRGSSGRGGRGGRGSSGVTRGYSSGGRGRGGRFTRPPTYGDRRDSRYSYAADQWGNPYGDGW